MKIGVDMLPVQSPGSRLRGVGRYGRDLVCAMIRAGGDREFVLYAHDSLPVDHLPVGDRVTHRSLRIEFELGEAFPRDPIAPGPPARIPTAWTPS